MATSPPTTALVIPPYCGKVGVDPFAEKAAQDDLNLRKDPLAITIEKEDRDQRKAQLRGIASDVPNQGDHLITALPNPLGELGFEGFVVAGRFIDQRLQRVANPWKRADEVGQRKRTLL